MRRALAQRGAVRIASSSPPSTIGSPRYTGGAPVTTGIEQLARTAASWSGVLSKSPSTRSSACVADTATARSSGPALRPASESGRRRPMTSPNRKSRSSSGPPRKARAGSMKSRLAQSSKLVAHTDAWPAAAKQPVSAPDEQP